MRKHTVSEFGTKDPIVAKFHTCPCTAIRPGNMKQMFYLGCLVTLAGLILVNQLQLGQYVSTSVKNETRRFRVYHHNNGRLGNLLFGYSSTMGIAHHNNRTPVFTGLESVRELFPEMKPKFLPKKTKWNHNLIAITKHFKADPRVFNLPEQDVQITGYLFNFKYFIDVFPELYRDIFSHFNNTLLKRSQKFISHITADYKTKNNLAKEIQPTTVCIHVRRGDFMTKRWQGVGLQVADEKDIWNAMKYMKQKYENSAFIVASNGYDWVKEHLTADDVYFSKFTSANQDFVLMSSCDHMIMTVGTFGWWMAFMTYWKGGTVMYYQHQFRKNAYLYQKCDRHDLMPSKWLAYDKDSVTKSGNLSKTCD